MTLYHLELKPQAYTDNKVYVKDPIEYGYVIRASTVEEARQIAYSRFDSDIWLSDEYTSVVELTVEGETGIIIVDLVEYTD